MKKLFGFLLLFSAMAFARSADQTYVMPHTGNIPGWGQLDLSKSAAVKNQLQPANGGLGINTTAATGVPAVSGGSWSIYSLLPNFLGGTGLNTSSSTGIAHVSSGTWSVGLVETADIDSQVVTQSKLALRAAPTGTQTSLGGIAQSQGSGGFSCTNSTCSAFTNVTNLTITLTTNGRPVWVGLTYDTTASPVYGGVSMSGTVSSVTCGFRFTRDGTNISQSILGGTGAATPTHTSALGAYSTLDSVSAGTHTYVFQVQAATTNTTCSVTNALLVAYEL